MKKTILILLGMALLSAAFAQNIDDLIFQESDDALAQDIISVKFEKKDARLAMLFSALVPGAGQFYAKPSAISAYLFPVIELGLIGGIVYFKSQGDKMTDEFEYFANGETVTHTFNYTVHGEEYSFTYEGPRYSRAYQDAVQTVLMNINPGTLDIYDGTFFRLDHENTQHFYEDIGKYNKYVFGWADWYHQFASDPRTGSFYLNQIPGDATWVWNPHHSEPSLIHHNRWIKNYDIAYYLNSGGDLDPSHAVGPGELAASPWRQEYLQMRRDTNKQYAYANYVGLGLAVNHIAAAIDAARLTRQVNRSSLAQNKLEFQYYTGLSGNNHLTPSLGLSYRF